MMTERPQIDPQAVIAREKNIARLSEPFDVAIIGGGASGLGAAVDAAQRGFSVVLCEAGDFVHGTSSHSSNMTHGGIRYLPKGQIGVVRTALLERGRLRRNAPHVVRDLVFVLPAYEAWEGPYYGVGMKLYDFLAGKHRVGRSRIISRADVLERLPTLSSRGLQGGIVYYDGQFDDARTGITLARTATALGATLLNYVRVVELVKENGRIAGVVAADAESGKSFRIRARAVLNATGVHADALRQLDEPCDPLLSPSQGVHIVLPPSFLPGTSALVIPRTDDGRLLFVMPWHGRVLLGTTDTPVSEVSERPRSRAEDVAFLLEHAARYLTRAPKREDVLSTYAGLRPLMRPRGGRAATQKISRDHALIVSESGLVTLIGGKWTTYRKMAEDAVDKLIAVAGLSQRECETADLPLFGAPPAEYMVAEQPGTPREALSAYGLEASRVRTLAEERAELAVPIHPNLPYLAAQVVFAAQAEGARTVEDVLARRTRALVLDARAAMDCAPPVAALLADCLGKDARWQTAQVEHFRAVAQEHLPS
ncbi:MAG: glycerol-3-phosphate dehydrogenase/oxidase [Myxococcaceae bacterium]